EMVADGLDLVRWCLRQDRPGPYQLHAAVNAVHASAPSSARTDWRQILALHDQLRIVQPTPVVELNRAVAVAEVHGPAAALELVEQHPLGEYYLWHATRADLLRRSGRAADAGLAYQQALDRCGNPAEQRFLRRRITECAEERHATTPGR
ncbi:MAG: RNA polymerase sigma factor, partial [Actinomycetota bacterium]|nr:RNA polymerase sigma factor [Actinomycetota bacterium]